MNKNCIQCSAPFEVTDQDFEFYKKVSPVYDGKKFDIPEPTLCVHCRNQRRLAWRNERSFYSRPCDLCQELTISIYNPSLSFPVYCNKCWWKDTWDPLSYGVEFDESRSFFEQFAELQARVPQLAIVNDDGVGSENCRYCQDFAKGKNCYLVFGSWESQDCYYCTHGCDHCRSVVDCTFTIDSELCYGCMNSKHLYNCRYMQNSQNCTDCFFGFDLIGCKNCFSCFGLRQKEYCYFNEQLTKEEYEKRIKEEFESGSYESVTRAQTKFDKWIISKPRRFANIQNCEECVGDNMFNSTHCWGFGMRNGEHLRYYFYGDSSRHSMDIYQSGGNELCYEGLTPDDSYASLFTLWCWKDKYVLYSDNCHNCEHCFGCVSLKRAKYCIFNKQYSQKEYEKEVARIITAMQRAGEWGEFFPENKSPFGYNESVAQEFYPLEQEEVEGRGWKWIQKTENLEGVTKTIPAARLPDNISEIPDDILNWAIQSETTDRSYKIIPQELAFYRAQKIPIPRLHSEERHLHRINVQNPYRLWKRDCAKCSVSFQTSFSPDRPEIVYCDECYRSSLD